MAVKVWTLRLFVVIGFLAAPTSTLAETPDDYIQSASLLHKDLLLNYSSHVRPAESQSKSVLVTLKPEIVRVEDIDEGVGEMTITIVMSQTWKDPRLKWKTSDYGGVTEIRLPLDSIWKPDIVLFNGPPDMASGFYDQLGIIQAGGTVSYAPFMTVTSYCAMDMTEFPNDIQTCSMMFGSWVYSKQQVDLQFGDEGNRTTLDVKIQADDTLEGQARSHPAWDVVGQSAAGVIFPLKFDCCPEEYTLMTFDLKLKRHPEYFYYIVVEPAVALAILIPVQFLMPVLGYQRTSVGLLIILCFTTLLVALCQYIPLEHSTTPKIGKFYVLSIAFSALAVAMSAIFAGLASKDKRSAPEWMKKLFLGRCGLRRLFCIDPTFPDEDRFPKGSSGILAEEEDPGVDSFPVSEPEPEPREMDNYANPSDKYLRSVAKSTAMIADDVKATAARDRRNGEWRDIVRVLDRFFFIVFCLMTAISLFSYVA